MTIRVGIINVTGFAGLEAARLLNVHPEAELVAVTGRSLAGQYLGEAFPHLNAVFGKTKITETIDVDLDVVLSALPTTESAELCAPFFNAGTKVIDIAADFRIKDAAEYQTWFGKEHPYPEILSEAVYGLPELNAEKIKTAQLIANPGCYPTAAILALAPAVTNGIISNSIIVDAKSGISGAGRGTGGGYSYSEVNEDVSAYRIGKHNHQPEIRQELAALTQGNLSDLHISFVPHLVPMTRGIHATCYAPLTSPITQEELNDLYNSFYEKAPFTHTTNTPPHTKTTLGSNLCLVHPVLDERNGMLIVSSVLDNLVKGAAGQAIENLNLLFDLPQTSGLPNISVWP